MLPLLEELKQITQQRPHVVLEATGNYSIPPVFYYSSLGYPVVVLNPLLTHELKKKAARKIKTDPIDALRIAQAFYLEDVSPIRNPDSKVAELYALCRQQSS